MDAGGDGPKLAQLLELIEEHPKAFARDFREKFGVSYLEIGGTVTYLEAWLLFQTLREDTSSWVQAAIAGWKSPVTREWIVQADAFDLAHRKVSKRKPKPYPRPWPESKTKIGGKRTTRRSIFEVMSILRPKPKQAE